ncbi:MAG: thioredoxin [Candidatus Dadabacteria bacterium]|nr:thioredoxin [Candidatus Dadabacteria bacterium]NIS07659.1 thioredoxin [Candidatus Dadabacteria bacterium]NIV42206.1 thioredoxin [Candidatus Dadabacteria bacterium]NIY21295.1 thioredoxin [Candidatus Dadabacteria bacterium]
MSIKISSDNFEKEVINSKKPVLVDFWAEWCGPCRTVGPALEEISEEYSDKFTLAKVNVDENPELVGEYGIRSIPTMILFKDGKQADSVIGALPKENIVDFVNENLQ